MQVGRTSRVSEATAVRLRKRLLVLILGRAMFVTVFGMFTAFIHPHLIVEFATPEVRLMSFSVLATLLASAVYLALYFRLPGSHYWLAFMQIQLDLLLWGVIISVTGGVNSYFTFLFSLSIVIAAVYLGERGVVFTLVLSVAIYVLVVLARLMEWFPGLGSLLVVQDQPEVGDLVIALVLDIGSMVLVALLGWVLALQVTRAGESLERTQEIFEDLHRLNEAVVTLLPSGLVTTDGEGRIRSTNPAVERLLGMEASRLVGSNLATILGEPPGAGDEVPAMRETTIVHGDVELQIEYVRAPLQDGTGREIGSIVHVMDVTELRRMRQKLVDFEKYRALGDLAVGLAHEIRNPLGSISGSIELVRESRDLDGEERRLLEIVQRETEKIGRLVTSLFHLARPPDPVIGPVGVATLVGEIRDMFVSDREARNLAIELDIPTDLEVLADREQLGQVVMNLIRNAAEASREGEGRIEIGGSSLGAGSVEITVADSGRGVDPELLDRIYDPYFTTKRYGLGVGLALCKEIVERHGGSVVLENRETGGAIARIRLPSA